jgi:hypothetical protein
MEKQEHPLLRCTRVEAANAMANHIIDVINEHVRISLSVTLLGGLSLGGLLLLELPLASLRLCDLPPVVLENSLVAPACSRASVAAWSAT